tara:strand:- start:3405 stop:3587 length:183 start_codon:yes stop_codon:yes gene_type:complete
MATTDLVNAILNDDNVEAMNQFNIVLADKINDALDVKKELVATDWLNSIDNEEEVETEVK